MKNNNIVFTYLMETLDWSTYQLGEIVNQIQERYDQKLILTGESFDGENTEYQLLIFSKFKPTEDEIKVAIQEAKEQIMS